MPARIVGAIPNALRYVLLAFLAIMTIAIGFFANVISYSFYVPVVRMGVPWLILISLLVGCACTAVVGLLVRAGVFKGLDERRRFLIFVGIGAVVLFVVQLILASQIRFYPGADSGVLTDPVGSRANSVYYSRYPHNLFCEGIFQIIASVAGVFGQPSFPWLVAGGCLSVTLAIALAALAAQRAMGTLCGTVVFIVGAVFLGLSPMAQVPYTDSYGMLWPALVLYIYVCVRNPRVRWPLIVGVSVLGACMKALSLAVFGAIVIVEACTRIRAACARRRDANAASGAQPGLRPRWQRWGGVVACCALAGIVAFGIAQAVRSIPDVALNPNMELGPAHYLLVGVGDKNGAYSSTVFDFSNSFETREERTAATIAAWQQRLSQLGPDGIAALTLAKAMTVLSSGNFFWGGDATQTITGTNDALLSFYGLTTVDAQATVDTTCPWNWFAQVIWGAVLIGCALGLACRGPSKAELVICVTLVMFCLYALIFEANPRYPFMFAPLFLILGVRGWEEAAALVANRFSRKS